MDIALAKWPPPLPVSPASPASPDSANGAARRWLGRLVAVALVVGSLFVDRTVVVVVSVLFVLVVPFEKLFPRHRGQTLRRPGLAVDITHAFAAPLLSIVGIPVVLLIGIASLAWVPGLALRPLVALIPGPVLPIAGIALFDLASYWAHRWSHEVPLLWKFHAVHHSTEQLDWVSCFRNHPFDGAIVAAPFFLLIAAGFDATLTGALAVVQVVTGLFLHANVRWRLKPLHRIVITPEFHHWHHTNEPEAHHANYSVLLPLWDTVFGTYFMPSDRRPQVYGIDESMAPTLMGQLGHPFIGVARPTSLARSAVRHPVVAFRAVRRSVCSLLGHVWRSTTRSTRGAARGR